MELWCEAGAEAEEDGEAVTGVEVGAGEGGGLGNGAEVVGGGSGGGTGDGEGAGTVAGRSVGVSGEGRVDSLGLEEGAWPESGPMTASPDCISGQPVGESRSF